eukprot:130564-Amphidinium_carterae.1
MHLQRSTGTSLQNFVPGMLVHPLADGERLQKLAAKAGDVERIYRMCITTEGRGKQWELQRVFSANGEISPALHVTIDQ